MVTHPRTLTQWVRLMAKPTVSKTVTIGSSPIPTAYVASAIGETADRNTPTSHKSGTYSVSSGGESGVLIKRR